MLNIYSYVIFAALMMLISLIYFKIAKIYRIVDKPNHRSSHTDLTIRGGGIIFPISLVIISLIFKLNIPFFVFGLLIICTVSFIDDIQPLSNKIRLLCHMAGVMLLFYQLNMFNFSLWLIFIVFIFVLGIINAMNFMDGINGITGIYALVAVLTMCYINEEVIKFISTELLVGTSITLSVFLFFNFRKKAICFAGDVGSVGVGFILSFLVLSLVVKTQDIRYILLLSIYGIDTFTTIVFRLIRKENVFEAHRSHYYQYLANRVKIPHMLVASIYGASQTLLNIYIIFYLSNNILNIICFIVGLIIMFVITRFITEGRESLLVDNNRTHT